MNSVSVNQFRENLKTHVESVIHNHEPIKVTRREHEAFVVVSLEDWEREQETLYVLQNQSLMNQINKSLKDQKSYQPSAQDMEKLFRKIE